MTGHNRTSSEISSLNYQFLGSFRWPKNSPSIIFYRVPTAFESVLYILCQPVGGLEEEPDIMVELFVDIR